MSYERFTDSLDRKILDFNLKMLGLLAALLLKPLANATEPLFRKNLGERYLTPMGAFVSFCLWSLVKKLADATPYSFQVTPLQESLNRAQCYDAANWVHTYNLSGKVGWLITAVYGVMAWRSLIAAGLRRKTGQPWYSMSRGESVFGSENKIRDIIISVVASLILLDVAPPAGALFLVSRFLSYYLEARQQSSIYNQYLDAMDAKIQNEYLQRALDQGEPPSATEGLYCPLPRGMKGEPRARVARVVAGGPFEGDEPETGREPQKQKPNPTTPKNEPVFAASVRSVAPLIKKAFRTGMELAKQIPSLVLKFKRIQRYGSVGLLVVAWSAAGIALFRSIESRRNQPVLASQATSAAAQPPKVSSTLPTQPISDARFQPQETPPVVTPAVATQNSAAVAQAALEAQQRQEAEKEMALAALELKKRQERKTAFEQMDNTITAQSAQLSKFKADCVSRLDNNTNKVAALSWFRRKRFKKDNDSNRAYILAVLQQEEDILNKSQIALRINAANPKSSPQRCNDQMTAYYAQMDKNHQQLTAILDAFDAGIAKYVPARDSSSF